MDRMHAARVTVPGDGILEAHVLGQLGLDRIRIVTVGQLQHGPENVLALAHDSALLSVYSRHLEGR
jgi:hypothetical protein